MSLRALVLDFGGPVLVTPFEVIRALEARIVLAPGTLDWTGPFDPPHDPLWRRVETGEISQPQYWAVRAQEFSTVTGYSGVRPLMALLYPAEDMDSQIRRQAYQAVRAAKAAGLRTAVLTNELSLFHNDEWIRRVGLFDEVDVVVDCSRTGVLKPDPMAYRVVVESLEIPTDQALFVDDHVPNVDGARAIGMSALHFDVTRPAQSYREVGRMLGLAGLAQVL